MNLVAWQEKIFTAAIFEKIPKVSLKELYDRLAIDMPISVPDRQNSFPLVLVKNELGAFSESLGPPLSRSYPIMAIAGL